MLIGIYKNWPKYVRLGGALFMDEFNNMEKALMEENEDIIDKLGLLEWEDKNIKLTHVVCCLVDFTISISFCFQVSHFLLRGTWHCQCNILLSQSCKGQWCSSNSLWVMVIGAPI
jgi:hypothetical protein